MPKGGAGALWKRGYPNALIYRLVPNGIERVAYEDTEHYKITRDSPERYFKTLFRRAESDDIDD